MMRLNNKGFAISTMLYGLLIVIVLIMFLLINTMSFNRKNSKEFTENIVKELENRETVNRLIDIVELGDYIQLTPTLETYTIPASETGYSADQTIKPNELTLWRVISKNENQIDVVSDSISSTSIFFGTIQEKATTITSSNVNVVAYRKFIKTLNTIASQYKDGKNIMISARYMGYDKYKATEEITNTNSLISTTVPWSCSTDTDCTAQESLGGGDLGYTTDCEMVNNVYGDLKANKVGISGISSSYWLASRYYQYYTSVVWRFNLRYVDGSGVVKFSNCYNHDNLGISFLSVNQAIRPILTLKSDVSILGGTGEKDQPYIL